MSDREYTLEERYVQRVRERDEARQQVFDLEAQLASAQKDAERYRSALLDFLAYFKSGNEVQVERAVIRADSMAVVMGKAALSATNTEGKE